MDTDFDAAPDANREYKDSMFTLLFGTKEAAIEVSNAVLGTCYGPDTDIKFTTLKNVLSMGRYNDISFMLDGKLIVLIEHQSTKNPNMPLRMLIYIGKIYNELVKGMDIYSEKMITVPEPVFFMFDIDKDGMPEDKQVLKLSDMYAKNADRTGSVPELELTVTVYNINKGHSLKIMERCITLAGYGEFVYKVRENQKNGMEHIDALQKAVNDCIEQNILKQFFIERKGEIMGYLDHEWKLDEAIAVAREEESERRALKTAKRLKDIGHMTVDEIAEATDLTVDDVLRL